MKHTQIIKLFGGIRPLARVLNHEFPSTVEGWMRRNRIPKWRWRDIIEAAEPLNIPLSEADFKPTRRQRKLG